MTVPYSPISRVWEGLVLGFEARPLPLPKIGGEGPTSSQLHRRHPRHPLLTGAIFRPARATRVAGVAVRLG